MKFRHKPCKKRKRDCNLAVPHFEALVLPLGKNSNTEAHAVHIYKGTRTRVYMYIHTIGILVSQCFVP